MIYDLSEAVARDLKIRRFPHPIFYGPERAKRGGFDMAIVFERDRPRGDQIGAPVGAKINPEVPFVRKVAGAVTVYARSPKPGARSSDHEGECDRVCDGVITALYRILKARRLPLEITDSKILEAVDFNGCETWPGCAARVSFSVTTLVRDVDYLGAGPPTGVVEAVQAPLVISDDFPDFDPVGA